MGSMISVTAGPPRQAQPGVSSQISYNVDRTPFHGRRLAPGCVGVRHTLDEVRAVQTGHAEAIEAAQIRAERVRGGSVFSNQWWA
jgi:hypothetical protein